MQASGGLSATGCKDCAQADAGFGCQFLEDPLRPGLTGNEIMKPLKESPARPLERPCELIIQISTKCFDCGSSIASV